MARPPSTAAIDGPGSDVTGRTRRWLWWALLGLVVASALVIGSRPSGHTTPADRVSHIASEVRCPTCAGQSADVSDAEAAKAVRTFVAREVRANKSDGRIEQELRSTYGGDILLRPPASGIDGLVWALPVGAFVVAIGALALAFRRWRSMTDVVVSPEDRERVAQAMAEEGR